MTTYEMQKIARMQAEFLVDAIKNDSELADIMFPPRCMNIEEASEYLRIPVSTLYNKIGEIPHEKVGKRLVFTDRGLMRWMKRSKATNIVELSIRKVM
jgi:excisionase family DNA binding protein